MVMKIPKGKDPPVKRPRPKVGAMKDGNPTKNGGIFGKWHKMKKKP